MRSSMISHQSVRPLPERASSSLTLAAGSPAVASMLPAAAFSGG